MTVGEVRVPLEQSNFSSSLPTDSCRKDPIIVLIEPWFSLLYETTVYLTFTRVMVQFCKIIYTLFMNRTDKSEN